MAEFTVETKLCRSPRPVRLYRSVYDNQHCGSILPANIQFISKKQYKSGQLEMYYISGCKNLSQMVGYWCPGTTLQTIPVAGEQEPTIPIDAPPDATLLKGKLAHIKGSNPIVYRSYEGEETIPNGLRNGDVVGVDYARTTTLNGAFQFRYHITSNSGDDQTLDGYWLLQNSSVKVDQDSKVEDEDEFYEMVRPYYEELAATPMVMSWWEDTLEAATGVVNQYIPGDNLPEINLPEFDLYKVIPDSWKNVIPENWMDYMPDGWTVPDRWRNGIPSDWINDIPLEWRPNIPKSWLELKLPELPPMSDVIGVLPDNWRDYMPPNWEIPDSWKIDGVPANWMEYIPESWRDRLPPEWKNFVFPDLKMADTIHNYITDQYNKVTTFMNDIRLPWQHDQNEEVDRLGNYVDYSEEDAVQQAFQNNHQYYQQAVPDASLMGFPVGRMMFVHGMPFQFTSITDRRNNAPANPTLLETAEYGLKNLTADVYGRSFAKEIAANMPVCTIVPGKPKFLTNVKDGFLPSVTDVKAKIQEIFSGTPSRRMVSDSMITSLTYDFDAGIDALKNNGEGAYEYYSLEIDTKTYFEYVNSLAHTSARLMGLDAEEYHWMGESPVNIDWGKFNTAESQDEGIYTRITGLNDGVSFAYDPTGSVSDQISNQTTESSLASTLNGWSAKAREVEFLLGYTSGVDLGELLDTANFTESAPPSVEGSALQTAISNTIGRVGSWLNNSILGMNIKFPEIWSESQHMQSYEITMHFISPYADLFSKWRYVLVPFFHAFALAAPRSDKNVSQYRSPFLIRAYSKGYFNVEMGIVESLNWKRYGDGSMISEDGIPLQIDVDLTFKDMYHVLTMTNMYSDINGEGVSNMENFFNNTGLMDMIGTLSGVNMNRINTAQRLELFAQSALDTAGSSTSNWMRGISDHVRNFMEKFYGF